MRAYADAMLSRMGRWLRMLGIDTVIADSRQSDGEILDAARRRVLITRDKLLYRRAKSRHLKAYYIQSRTVREQLHEFFSLTGAGARFPETTRCPLCNSLLKKATRGETDAPRGARGLFWKCPGCGKSYWQGSHWAKISKLAEEVAPS